MKGKAVIPLVVGLGIGVFAVKMAVDAVRKAQADGASVTTVNVVRATRDIKPFERLSADAIELIETEANVFIPEDERIESLDEVIGRVTAKPIVLHAPILRSTLAPEGTPPGMVGRIPDGYRAVSVQIDEVTAVAYQIQPGDWVDVIVVMDVSTPLGGRETIAEVILQRIQIAAIGDTTTAVTGPGASRARPARSVTLFVVEEDVPKLHLASTQGKITLAMRGDDPATNDNPRSANMRDVMSTMRGQETKPATPVQNAPPDWMTSLMNMGSKAPPPELLAEEEPPPPYAVTIHHGLRGGSVASAIERITFEHSQSSNIIDVGYGPQSRRLSTLKPSRKAGRSNRKTTRSSTLRQDD